MRKNCLRNTKENFGGGDKVWQKKNVYYVKGGGGGTKCQPNIISQNSTLGNNQCNVFGSQKRRSRWYCPSNFPLSFSFSYGSFSHPLMSLKRIHPKGWTRVSYNTKWPLHLKQQAFYQRYGDFKIVSFKSLKINQTFSREGSKYDKDCSERIKNLRRH